MSNDRLQKTRMDGADVTWRGSSFQTRVAATGKARDITEWTCLPPGFD